MGIELAAVIVFFIGFYGTITARSVLKSVISISLMELAVVMFFLIIGYTPDDAPPIGENLAGVADPLPQALVITTIVMGVAVIAVNLTMLIALYRKHGAGDWDELRKQNDEESTKGKN